MTTESILIVDDEAGIRVLLATILTAEGHRCRQAASGSQALTAMAAEECAVVLVDLEMPEMNGLDLLARMAERGSFAVPIVLTGYESVDAAVRSMKLGAFDFLTKPINLGLLRAAVARALNYARVCRQERVLAHLTHEWQATFDACPDAMAVIDAKARLVRCNSEMARWLGRSKESLPGVALRELPGGARQAQAADAFLGAGQEEVFDPRWQRTFKVITAPIGSAADATLGVVYIARDITDAKQVETLLRSRQDRLNRILENLAEGVLIINQLGQVVFVNSTAERLTGQPRTEFIGQGLDLLRRMFTGPDGQPTFAEAEPFGNVLCGGEAILGIEAAMHVPGRGSLGVVLNAAPLPDSAGGVEGVLLSFADVTQRQQAEQSLRESEERYRLLFERGQAGVLRTTADGKVLDSNDAFARTLGLASRQDVLRLSSRDFYFKPADREIFLALLQQKQALTNHEMCFRRQDGSAAWVLPTSICCASAMAPRSCMAPSRTSLNGIVRKRRCVPVSAAFTPWRTPPRTPS